MQNKAKDLKELEKRTHVPDKMEAYSLQVRHAFYELLSSIDGEKVVSIELYDDVAIKTTENIEAHQLKNVISSSNPVSNHAVAFWKTLYNWGLSFETKVFDKSLKFRLVIISDRELKVGDILLALEQAVDTTSAKVALDNAREYFKKEESVSKSLKEYLDYCLSPEREDVIIEIIKNFQICLHVQNYDIELKERFYRQTIPSEYADQLFVYMLGWVNEKVHSFTKKNQAPVITTQEYREALQKQIRGLSFSNILSAFSQVPQKTECDEEMKKHDVYIQQLELIDADENTLFNAINDYLRTSVEITEWADKGIVTDLNLNNYGEQIYATWKNKKELINLDDCADDIKKGKRLYYNCREGIKCLRLQGCDVPPFFAPGYLQRLANEPQDMPRIGWHPNYIELLRKEKDNNNE
ncbi:MAG: hypothetical protein IKL76_03815 [Clostridia bacterium]|nr:hypothetical protein [Clostridia bacterium]